MYSTTEVFIQENTMVTHEAIPKYIHICVYIYIYIYIVMCILVTEMGFGLVIGFINHSQVVTTITYNTVPDFYFTSTPCQSSESVSTCLLPATALNAGIITLTLQISHAKKVSHSPLKSSIHAIRPSSSL
jgi:hypothetical protein